MAAVLLCRAQAGNVIRKKSRDGAARTARVPLRAKNNLGRLSADLQDRLAAMLEGTASEPFKLHPADVTLLQKILPTEKALAKLPKPSHKKLMLAREDDDVVLSIEEGDEVVCISVLELGGILSRPLV